MASARAIRRRVALVLVFPDDDESGGITLVPHFWVPADNAEKRERRDGVPYLTWGRQGFIELTPGNVIHYDRIKLRIEELAKRFDIYVIAIDRWNATQITRQLRNDRRDVVPQAEQEAVHRPHRRPRRRHHGTRASGPMAGREYLQPQRVDHHLMR